MHRIDEQGAGASRDERRPAVSDEAVSLTQVRKRRARIALIGAGIVVVAAVVFIVARMLTTASAATTTVSTVAAAKRTLTIAVSGSGSAAVADSQDVYPLVSGTVATVYVSEGETVTAGQKLYSIDTADIDAAIAQAKGQLLQAQQGKLQASSSYAQAVRKVTAAKAALAAARAQLATVKADATSTAMQISSAETAVTSATGDLADARTGVSSAAIGVKVASLNLTTAQTAYSVAAAKSGDTVVTSPIDGVVTNLPLAAGTQVSARTAGSSSSSASSGSSTGGTGSSTGSSTSGGVTISNLTNLEVQMTVSEVDVASVKAGQEATVTFDAVSGKTFKGHVTSVANTGSSSSGVVSYQVNVLLDSTDSRLKVGMTATVDITTEVAENVLTVPSTAVGTDNSTKYVQVVDASGAVTKKTVTIGVSDDTYIQILSGLADGDKVVVGTVSSSTSSSSSSSNSKSSSAFGAAGMGGPPGMGGN